MLNIVEQFCPVYSWLWCAIVGELVVVRGERRGFSPVVVSTVQEGAGFDSNSFSAVWSKTMKIQFSQNHGGLKKIMTNFTVYAQLCNSMHKT